MTRRELLLALLAAPFVPRRVPALALRADWPRIVSDPLTGISIRFIRSYDAEADLMRSLVHAKIHMDSQMAEQLRLAPRPPWKTPLVG